MEQCETEGCCGVVFKHHLCLVCANKLFDTATSSDASELVKEILAETEHWDVMPECREKGDLELVIGLLKRCLPLLPSNERVSKKEAQLLVGALQEFHVLSDLGGDIEDHEVGEIYTRLQRQALGDVRRDVGRRRIDGGHPRHRP